MFFFRSAEFKTDPLIKVDIHSLDDLDFCSSPQVRLLFLNFLHKFKLHQDLFSPFEVGAKLKAVFRVRVRLQT